MLSKENRLKKKNDFENVFKNGRGFKAGFFYLKAVRNSSGSDNILPSRFGFVVSKKISNKAVVRNKIKRLIRDFFQLNLGRIKKGLDCVLVVLSPIKKEDYAKISENLDRILKKSGIYG